MLVSLHRLTFFDAFNSTAQSKNVVESCCCCVPCLLHNSLQPCKCRPEQRATFLHWPHDCNIGHTRDSPSQRKALRQLRGQQKPCSSAFRVLVLSVHFQLTHAEIGLWCLVYLCRLMLKWHVRRFGMPRSCMSRRSRALCTCRSSCTSSWSGRAPVCLLPMLGNNRSTGAIHSPPHSPPSLSPPFLYPPPSPPPITPVSPPSPPPLLPAPMGFSPRKARSGRDLPETLYNSLSLHRRWRRASACCSTLLTVCMTPRQAITPQMKQQHYSIMQVYGFWFGVIDCCAPMCVLDHV